jgi:hypothetical protein
LACASILSSQGPPFPISNLYPVLSLVPSVAYSWYQNQHEDCCRIEDTVEVVMR